MIEGITYILDKTNKPYYEIFVQGDVNDGDYTSATSILTEKEFEYVLETLKLFVKNYEGVSYAFKDHDEYLEDKNNDKIIHADEFYDYVEIPYIEPSHPHTIKKVIITYHIEDKSYTVDVLK